MKLVNIVPGEFIIKDEPNNLVTITATSVGSNGEGGLLFIVPMHIDSGDVIPDRWGVERTMRGFPKLRSNADPTPGVVIKLSSYSEPGKRIGKIFVLPHDQLRVIGFGVGAMHYTRWEEALVECRAETLFYIQPTNGPDVYMSVTVEGEVYVGNAEFGPASDISEYLRISDQNIPRWKDGESQSV